LLIGQMLERQAQVSVENPDGLPVMLPLTHEAPEAQRLTEPELRRVDVLPLAPRELPPEVWVYGWGVKATRGLMALLEEGGLRASVGRTEDVRKASAREVVLAPLQSVESVKRRGLRAQLVLVGRSRDEARARALGAQDFLSGPLRSEQLLDSVREALRAGREALRQVG
jgi:type IV pilus assembly protein PilB